MFHLAVPRHCCDDNNDDDDDDEDDNDDDDDEGGMGKGISMQTKYTVNHRIRQHYCISSM